MSTLLPILLEDPGVVLARVVALIPYCSDDTVSVNDLADAVDDVLENVSLLGITDPVVGYWGAADLLSNREYDACQACGDEPYVYSRGGNDPDFDPDGRWERWKDATEDATAAAQVQFRADMAAMLRQIADVMAADAQVSVRVAA